MNCPKCGQKYKDDDIVFLDEWNGTTHRKCYSEDPVFIVDVGTYKEIINKYDFFKQLKA